MYRSGSWLAPHVLCLSTLMLAWLLSPRVTRQLSCLSCPPPPPSFSVPIRLMQPAPCYQESALPGWAAAPCSEIAGSQGR